MEYEIKANKYSLNCIKIGIFCVMFFFTMNEIGVFIVDKPLVRKAAIPTLIIYFLTVIIQHNDSTIIVSQVATLFHQ